MSARTDVMGAVRGALLAAPEEHRNAVRRAVLGYRTRYRGSWVNLCKAPFVKDLLQAVQDGAWDAPPAEEKDAPAPLLSAHEEEELRYLTIDPARRPLTDRRIDARRTLRRLGFAEWDGEGGTRITEAGRLWLAGS